MQEITLPVQTVEKVIGLEEVESTHNLAKELAEQGEAANTMVLACCQTNGRGRFERTFSAQEGGIYFTLILRPATAGRMDSLYAHTAQAVSEALGALFEIKTKVKTPNDILAWDAKTHSWKKLGGVLIEASAPEAGNNWLLVGVGINVNNPLPASIRKTAVSLKQLLGQNIMKEVVLEDVLEHFWRHYAQWEASSR